jgi:glyoxylase-like metal-dependent hydrolase (beta-lactamase superfamily II)
MAHSIERAFDRIRRFTHPLPTRPGHVHAYLLEDGTLVDTGLGLPDAAERWRGALAHVEVERVVVTHFHPDHVGASADVAALTGAPVFQGVLDYEQCVHVWGNPDWPSRIADWFLQQGAPQSVADDLVQQGSVYRPFIRFARDPLPLREGDRVGGWDVLELPGHADGHLGLLSDGTLLAGDHLLPGISPAIGLWPDSRPDPLGDYLDSLRRTIELAPRVAYGGHGEPIGDPPGRARELLEHHRLRLDETAAALREGPRTGYDVSFAVFGALLAPAARRFAVAETLSHLERLVVEGRAARGGDGRVVTYTAS